ncbi:MAG: hypothetical protein ACK40R_00740 [Thermomonas sp.]
MSDSNTNLTRSLRALTLASTGLGLVLGYTPAQAQQSASAAQNGAGTPAAQAAQQDSKRGYLVGNQGTARATASQDGAEDGKNPAAQAAPGSNRGYVVGNGGTARATTGQDGAEDGKNPAAQAAPGSNRRGYVVGDGGVARRTAASAADHFLKIDQTARKAAPATQQSPQDPQTQKTTQPKGSYRYLKRQATEAKRPGTDGTP